MKTRLFALITVAATSMFIFGCASQVGYTQNEPAKHGYYDSRILSADEETVPVAAGLGFAGTKTAYTAR